MNGIIQPSTHKSLSWSLALLAFAQLIISLDINIVFVALPEIGRELGFPEQTLQWVVSAYTVFCGGFLLFGGRAVDLLGQRRIFIFALWLYALSSLLGGLAWNPVIIIAARAVQGIGGAFLFPATLSLINRLFEEGSQRNKALAVWGGAGASGLTIGSLAGGLVTNYFGWPSVFFVNVILAGIAIIAAYQFIPRDEFFSRQRSFDVPGTATVTTGATLLVYALIQGPEDGWGSNNIIYSIISAIILLVVFIVIEIKSKDPLMPMRLFNNRNLVAGVIVSFIYMGTFGALPYFETLLFQNIMGYSALKTGIAFVVPSIAIFIGTQLGAKLANMVATRYTIILGFLIGGIGTVLMTFGASVESTYYNILPGLIISGLGQGIVWTAMWIASATGVSHNEQGVASGMASTTLNIGNAVGLAALIAIASFGIVNDGSSNAKLVVMAAQIHNAFYLAACGMLLPIIISLILKPLRNTFILK